MKTAILIVTYQSAKTVKTCLNNLKNIKNTEIYLVDNSPNHKIEKLIKNKFPKIHFKKNEENKGFAYAQNQAYKMSENFNPDLILTINPDIKITPKQISQLKEELKAHFNVAVIGPSLKNQNNQIEENIHLKPTVIQLFFKALGIDIRKIHNQRIHSKEKNQEVYSITGACMLIKNSIIKKTGYFDTDYFFYYEDLDLCTRIQNAGKKVIYTPKIMVEHFKGKSRETVPNPEEWSKTQTYISRTKYFIKHKSKIEQKLLKLFYILELNFRKFTNYDRNWAIKTLPKIIERL